MAAIGCLSFFVIVVFCAGIGLIIARKEKKVENAKEDPPPPTVDVRAPKKSSISATGATAPPPEPVQEIPRPRPALNTPPAGIDSAWVRIGEVETRVIGARITRPVLVDYKGKEFRGPDPVLLVWVQTRLLSGKPVEVRRWIGSLNSDAKLIGAGGVIDPVRFSGALVQGQLKRAATVSAGGSPATDLLAFRIPEPAVQTLTLSLDGSHVGEGEKFIHSIPPEVWKK